MDQQTETAPTKRRGRGRSHESLDIIAAMYAISKEMQPITGRGIGYKLFTLYKLIPDMTVKSMAKVYRLLGIAREEGIIPWEWIVEDARQVITRPSWANPDAYVRDVSRGYRRDFWLQQPKRVQVWSEKSTVSGVLDPVLEEYGVDFLSVHGFNSKTKAHDIAIDNDGRPMIVIYVDVYDPSGMCMTEADLPKRFERYGGTHIDLRRVALTREQCNSLISFPASDKRGDPRYNWFTANYGDRCWELDAMDPRELRALVEQAIRAEIDWPAWERCAVVERAEKESLRTVLDGWRDAQLAPEQPAPESAPSSTWRSPLI